MNRSTLFAIVKSFLALITQNIPCQKISLCFSRHFFIGKRNKQTELRWYGRSFIIQTWNRCGPQNISITQCVFAHVCFYRKVDDAPLAMSVPEPFNRISRWLYEMKKKKRKNVQQFNSHYNYYNWMQLFSYLCCFNLKGGMKNIRMRIIWIFHS